MHTANDLMNFSFCSVLRYLHLSAYLPMFVCMHICLSVQGFIEPAVDTVFINTLLRLISE